MGAGFGRGVNSHLDMDMSGGMEKMNTFIVFIGYYLIVLLKKDLIYVMERGVPERVTIQTICEPIHIVKMC